MKDSVDFEFMGNDLVSCTRRAGMSLLQFLFRSVLPSRPSSDFNAEPAPRCPFQPKGNPQRVTEVRIVV